MVRHSRIHTDVIVEREFNDRLSRHLRRLVLTPSCLVLIRCYCDLLSALRATVQVKLLHSDSVKY